MSDNTAIEWAGATWNPVTGCTKVSAGCAHCYITRTPPFFFNRRTFKREGNEQTTGVLLHPERLDPAKVAKLRPLDKPIFVCSLADLFHESVPAEYVNLVFDVMAACSHRTFQVLTKRPHRAHELLRGRLALSPTGAPLPNVWMGVSIENSRYTWRADILREIPAALRFVSAEPLLGSLFARDEIYLDHPGGAERARPRRALDLTRIDWLIAGGESGWPLTRPMHPVWARELRDACFARNTAFFFKQWGSWSPSWLGDTLRTRIHVALASDGRTLKIGDALEDANAAVMAYRGPDAYSGGRHLDGRTWDAMPRAAAAA